MYAAVPFFVLMAVLNGWLPVGSGEIQPLYVAGAGMFVGLAVLTFVSARRGARPRPPYSTWKIDQHLAAPQPPSTAAPRLLTDLSRRPLRRVGRAMHG